MIRSLSLYGDKRASEEVGRKLERLTAFKQARRALDAELLAFLESLTADVIKKLASWGLIDQAQAGAGMPLMQVKETNSNNGKKVYEITGGHLVEYRKSLESNERNPRHIVQVMSHCQKIISYCRFVFPLDINVSRVESAIQRLRSQGLAARTVNSYLVDMKAFCSWLVERGTLPANPLSVIKSLNQSADKRHIRRALTEQEIEQLIVSTVNSKKHHGLTGLKRSLVYRLAIETGLRWNEIYTLKRSDFDLTQTLSVTIQAANAKNGREETLPIRQELASDLSAYFSTQPALPIVQAFNGMWKGKGYEMLNMDLEAAGIERENGQGIIDFHSLRHTFGTLLAKAGVAPKVAMDLMRHSDVNLTMRLYSHTVLQDRARAIESLPTVTNIDENLDTTGTEC